jgi:hypothetical protein
MNNGGSKPSVALEKVRWRWNPKGDNLAAWREDDVWQIMSSPFRNRRKRRRFSFIEKATVRRRLELLSANKSK